MTTASTNSGLRVLQAISTKLTQAGAPFEMATVVEDGASLRVWKNGPQTLSDIFAATSAFEAREFIVLGEQRVTYGAFRKAAVRIARWLSAKGVTKGDLVAIAMTNRAEWLAAYFGTALAGAASTLINPAGSDAELAQSVSLARPRILVCSTDGLPAMLRAMRPEGVETILAAGGQVSDVSDSGIPVELLRDITGPVESWDELPVETAPEITLEAGELASVLFTAGTTGLPKGVCLTHRACAYSVFHAGFRNARQAALAGKAPIAPDGQQVLLMVLPFFHTSGICNAVLPLMMRGGRVVLMNFWSPRMAVKLIAREGAHIFGSVPTVVEQLVGEMAATGVPPSLQQCICGGGPPSSQLATKLARLGITPGQNWGMTETAGALLGLIGDEFVQRPNSCGLPAPIHEVRVVSQSGEDLKAGEVGELQVRGPQIMSGYLHDRDATAAALVDGWLRTGDLGLLDEDGYCFIVDRAKDMLICAGENVYCIEVENAIAMHTCVEEVAVFGAPHPLMGEQPVAVVKPKEGAVLTETDVRAHAASLLPLFKTPSRVLIISDPLPRNRLGKIQKSELRRRLNV